MKQFLIVLASFVALSSVAFAAEVKYTTHIKLLFEQKCEACHGSDAPEYADFKKDKEKYAGLFKGPKMTGYANLVFFTGWPDTGALMRRLDDGANTKDRKPGNMYQYLGADDAERVKNLKLFRDWVGNWVLKRWPDMTKEDLNGITVKY
ncbi:MAG: cytochrome C [Nitrospirae bacterium]|nr:cytochrome C [Nitrospirota bacterium]